MKKGKNKRDYNFHHSSLIGSACRSQKDFVRIINSSSADPVAKTLAGKILSLQSQLTKRLRDFRVNEDKTITKLQKDTE